MSPLLFAALALAGGLGAGLRYLLDALVARVLGGGHPWGTVVINLSGSFLLGLVSGLGAGAWWDARWGPVLGTGLLGGYTTFSTASLEVVRLAQRRRWVPALAHGVGMLAGGVALAGVGYLVGTGG